MRHVHSPPHLRGRYGTAAVVARLGMLFVMLGVYPPMLMPMVAPLRGSEPCASSSFCTGFAVGIEMWLSSLRACRASIEL